MCEFVGCFSLRQMFILLSDLDSSFLLFLLSIHRIHLYLLAASPRVPGLTPTPACLSLGLSLSRCWPAGEGSGGSSVCLPIPGSLALPGLDSHRPRAHSPPRLSRSSWWLGWSAHLAAGSLQERSCMFAFRLLLLLGLRRGPQPV